jgi:hypothetical protein
MLDSTTIIDGVVWLLRLNLYVFAAVGLLVTIRVVQFRWRLRKVRLYWYARPLGIVPLFASFFLGLIIILKLLPVEKLPLLTPVDLNIYMLMGICLFVLTRELSLVYVTNNGIVKNVINPKQTIAWFHVVDFAAKETQNGWNYVFIYKQDGTKEPARMDILIPERKKDAFDKLVHQHLSNLSK